MSQATLRTRRLVMRSMVGAFWTLVAVSGLVAQASTTPPPLQRAIGLFGQQDYEAARVLLDSLVTAEPENGQAWSALGFSLLSLEQWEDARAALETAAESGTASPRAALNLAVVLGQLGEMDQAFTKLSELKAGKATDLTTLGQNAAAAPLRNDPRLASDILPTAFEYADPFGESGVKPIHEWVGEEAGGQFGWIARSAGDIDGDGLQDVVTSAPTFNSGAGKIYVYSSADGRLIWDATGGEGFQLGTSVETAGDVDGDGVDDVAAGAPGANLALIYSGVDGSVIHRLEAVQEGERFGRKVGGIGDMNGDGRSDLLVGAPLNDEKGTDAGAAYVFSGSDGALLLTLYGEAEGDNFGIAGGGAASPGQGLILVGAPNAGPDDGGRTYAYRGLNGELAFVMEADETGAQMGGMFVSVVGDVDADGIPDAYSTDFANGALGPTTGRAYIHSGADGRRLYTFTGEVAGDAFGIGTAEAGDLDGDGHDDLIIGAWQHRSLAASGGRLYLHSGADGHLMGRITGKVMGETLGFDATGVGDVTGDGVPDLLVTSAWSAKGGTRNGRMFILSGADVLGAGLEQR